ncbi:MAG: sensor histidine kinase [Taibaiella sp.]|nr:sensor histidine kinase [Taibaiella sp.]
MKYILLILLSLPLSLLARKEGQEQLDSLLSTLPNQKEDTNKVKVLSTISFLDYQYNPEQGLQYGNEALVLAKALGWKPGMANAYNAVGANWQMLGDGKKSLECFMSSLKINEELNDKTGIAQSLGNIALVYSLEGNSAMSLQYLFKALRIFEELNDKDGIATQYINIGALYDEQNNAAKALMYDTLALRIFREMGDKAAIANQLGNIGNVYMSLKKYDDALACFQESLSLNEELGNKAGTARDLSNISTYYGKMRDYVKALETQLSALKIFEAMGYELGTGLAEANVGTYYYDIALNLDKFAAKSIVPKDKKSCLQLAEYHLQRGIALVMKNDNLQQLAFAYKSLSGTQAEMGNYKDALENFKNYSKINDSLFSIENNKKIQNLENQRELDLKESKIKILSQENNMKDLRAAKDKQTRRALVGGIGMVVVIAISLVMYYVRKQKNDKLIANERINTLLKDQELKSVSSMLEVQEQERKRIAADLHDRLGSMLSTVKLYFNTVEEQIDNLKTQNKEQYHKATALLDEACDEVRKISHNLVSGELVKFGLVSALNQLKNTIEDTGKMKMNVLAFGMEERLDSTMEISLYRVVQELMNNMLKHAKASEVTIQLNRVEDNLNIVVEDNGIGFDVAAALEKDGMGLRNMETRVKKMQGVITFDSGKGRGTTTIIDIPV